MKYAESTAYMYAYQNTTLTINQFLMIYCHATNPTYEPEVIQMILVKISGVWINLESVVIAVQMVK